MAEVMLNQPLGTSMSPASMTVSPRTAPPQPPPVQMLPPAPPITQGSTAMQQAAQIKLNMPEKKPEASGGGGIGSALGTAVGGLLSLKSGGTVDPGTGMSIGKAIGSILPI